MTRSCWTTTCRRKRSLHASWCFAVSATDVLVAIVSFTVRRDRSKISDKSVAPFARTRSHYLKLNAPVRRIRRCHFSVPNTWTALTVPGRDGRGIREKPHRARRESCDVAGASHARGRLGRELRPRSRYGTATVNRRRSLLQDPVRVDGGVPGTTTLWSPVTNGPGRRSPNRLERGRLGTAISAKSADVQWTARDVP
jgi:hypothetical protein